MRLFDDKGNYNEQARELDEKLTRAMLNLLRAYRSAHRGTDIRDLSLVMQNAVHSATQEFAMEKQGLRYSQPPTPLRSGFHPKVEVAKNGSEE